MAFLQVEKDALVDRLNGGNDESASQVSKFGQQVAMFEQVLDLDGCVEGDIRKFCMQSASNAHGVCWPVEEIGIAKSDVACTLCYLCANICKHNPGWYR